MNAFAPIGDDGPAKGMHAKVVAAIDELHATLDAEQRAELVSILKERQEARAAKRAQKKAHRGERKRAKVPGGKMLRGLDVTDEQRAAIETALADAGLDRRPDHDAKKAMKAEMKERRAAMLDAFSGADFEASSQLPPPAKMANHHEHFLATLAVVTPILDVDQRAELANRIEEGPKHFGKRGKRGDRGAKRR